jgi:3-dehydroshikimate dehydratase
VICLSAFADEISPDLDEQIAVLQSEGIRHLELRGVWNINVLDLTDEQVSEIKRRLDAAGMAVSGIGSPIGKVPIDHPFDEHLRRFERAVELAQAFDTSFIRIFSFYPPEHAISSGGTAPPAAAAGDGPEAYRDDVLQRLQILTERAGEASVTLLHENEKDIYGDTIARCVTLMEAIDDEHLRTVLDPANFIQCGQTPYPDAYEALRPWIRSVHVKDAAADGTVVPAGEGMARWPELLDRLRAGGYQGFFSLEPHLAEGGRFSGFSGPELFRRASQAFQRLLREMGWEYV